MKELIDMNKQIIEESTKNRENAANNYENTFTAFVKKWAWRINNLFSGISLSTYGIIGCVIGYLLYKFGKIGLIAEYLGQGIENIGLIIQGKHKVIKYVKEYLDFLYKDSTIYLDRKYNKYLKIIDIFADYKSRN